MLLLIPPPSYQWAPTEFGGGGNGFCDILRPFIINILVLFPLSPFLISFYQDIGKRAICRSGM